MAKGSNPYTGTYAPSVTALNKNDLIKGLKGLKVKHPNRHMSETAYKSGLKKEPESGSC